MPVYLALDTSDLLTKLKASASIFGSCLTSSHPKPIGVAVLMFEHPTGKLSTVRTRNEIEIVPLTLSHSEKMYHWMLDPAVSENIGLRSEPSPQGTTDWIKKSQQDATTQPFAILFRGQHVGNVVLDRIDNYLHCSRLSIYIGEPTARGSGVGLTAAYLAMTEGFERLSLDKIYLTVHSRNFPAINTYTRLGFALEGILRDEFLIGSERISALYMGILKKEFLEGVIFIS